MQSLEFDDYLGVESCADLKPEFEAAPPRSDRGDRRRKSQSGAESKAAFPPPIPWLARTERMEKYSTGDGGLIIKEEKLHRYEYFRAVRSNGRLVLNLVPLDDVVSESCCQPGDEKVGAVSGGLSGEKAVDGCEEGIRDPTVEEKGGVLYMYNGTGLAPCGGFAVDVAAAAAAALRPPVSI